MKKILIVDDEYHSRLLLEEILEEYVENTEIISNELSSDGLETIQKEKPDVVFLDVMMPVVKGTEICRQIKNHPDLKQVRIILISAGNPERALFHYGLLQADAYIQKPFSAEKVVRTLQSVLNREEGSNEA